MVSMNTQKNKPGPHKQMWARRTWIHRITGAELTIERSHPDDCYVAFRQCIVSQFKHDWREKK